MYEALNIFYSDRGITESFGTTRNDHANELLRGNSWPISVLELVRKELDDVHGLNLFFDYESNQEPFLLHFLDNQLIATLGCKVVEDQIASL